MIRYSDKTRNDALETYRNEGITVACERYHVPSSTIYRWLSIEKREALLSQVAQENREGAPLEDKEQSKVVESIEESPELHADETNVSEEDIPDMMTLLIAENEKLRTMNLQLRKALQAFVL